MLSVNREAENTKVTGIDLTQLGIKPESTALEADALTTRSVAHVGGLRPFQCFNYFY